MLRNDSLVDTAFLFYMRSKGQTYETLHV